MLAGLFWLTQSATVAQGTAPDASVTKPMVALQAAGTVLGVILSLIAVVTAYNRWIGKLNGVGKKVNAHEVSIAEMLTSGDKLESRVMQLEHAKERLAEQAARFDTSLTTVAAKVDGIVAQNTKHTREILIAIARLEERLKLKGD